MAIWHKRFVIWFNLAILFIFLDGSLLIFVRSIDSDGIYQTMAMKWLTFSIWALCYALICLCQAIVYLLLRYKHSKKHGKRHFI